MNTTVTLSTPARVNLAPLTRRLPTVARSALGFVFCLSGLDGFLHFLPQPDMSTVPAAALALGAAFAKSGYLFQLIVGTEAAAGALLLLNRFVPLALVILAPVLVNIVAFHAFLAPDGLGLAIALTLIALYLAWTQRAVFRPLLAARSPG
jgi:hypothetical protein